MKVFLDTNILASALATRGLCADVLRVILANEELVTSVEVLVELKRVLVKKFRMPKQLAVEVMAFLKLDTAISAASINYVVIFADKDDALILSAALSAQSDVFVTGDKLVLGLKKIGKMRILSAREYWESLRIF